VDASRRSKFKCLKIASRFGLTASWLNRILVGSHLGKTDNNKMESHEPGSPTPAACSSGSLQFRQRKVDELGCDHLYGQLLGLVD
jgi:hypothetical protein